jgi:hypothetical protein
MKKIYAKKSSAFLVPQPRSFRRLFKRMFAGILQRQKDVYQDVFQSEVIQQLKNLENEIETVKRTMARQARRKQ